MGPSSSRKSSLGRAWEPCRLRSSERTRNYPVAVVATAAATSRSVVFYEGKGRPRKDNRRAIDYFPTSLHLQHVMASSAIPLAFPAVEISKARRPPETRWFFDGGTRLNTPIKPALRLGADRVIVIALNSVPQRDEITRPVKGQPDA